MLKQGKALLALALAGSLVLGLQVPAHAKTAESSTGLAVANTVKSSLRNFEASTELAKVTTQVAQAKTVVVVPGDTLSKLAARHCGTGAWQGIYQDNRAVVGGNPNLIYPGQQLVISCSSSGSVQVQSSAPPSSGRAQAIVDYALAQVGKPYVWAAAGPYSFDCSGLVMMALAQIGVRVPHQDQGILYSGQGYPVSRANLQPGDVVWPWAGHVFIYIGNGKIVEAAGYGTGVIVNNLYAFSSARRYV
jgi:cell wall-associated NlpC family hydrolase